MILVELKVGHWVTIKSDLRLRTYNVWSTPYANIDLEIFEIGLNQNYCVVHHFVLSLSLNSKWNKIKSLSARKLYSSEFNHDKVANNASRKYSFCHLGYFIDCFR